MFYFKNVIEENISQEVRPKNIDKTPIFLIEEINRNQLMSKKHKKVCTSLNYTEHFLILGSTITGCAFISAFDSLASIPIGITSSEIELKNCEITAGIKKCKLLIKEKKRNNDQIVLLEKSKLNSIEALTSKALIDSVISHDEFVWINSVLKK